MVPSPVAPQAIHGNHHPQWFIALLRAALPVRTHLISNNPSAVLNQDGDGSSPGFFK
jgi:pterin-4a-carbinolamine dehydratase